MVNILSLDSVKAIVGDAGGALTVITDDVGTTVDSLDLTADTPLDNDMSGKLGWIRDTFTAAITDVLEQVGITVEATNSGATVLENADIDARTVTTSRTA